ncbi:MAG: metal-sulfur cluster assembly factor [Gemmatimonadetes bacterium]|nr:metal-sulfur cluster assembly factor [Gemmatimonadota bacterium]MDA1103877.1 metal-sulfur cluster assembly factor [Gemmatimonadota bacterium]
MSSALPVVGRLDVGLPVHISVHKSGGRDVWSAPLESAPEDAVQATWDALNEVLDPEIPISLPELGLVYGVEVEGGVATVSLTYTATACPCMEFIREDITDRLISESWIDSVELVELWDPPWTSERITPEGRAKLKLLGVSA